jgi:hypothetical protein
MINRVDHSTTILVCPFCGNHPEVIGSGERQRGLMIHCITDGCVNPSVSYYEHDAARRVWNRRDGRHAAVTSTMGTKDD